MEILPDKVAHLSDKPSASKADHRTDRPSFGMAVSFADSRTTLRTRPRPRPSISWTEHRLDCRQSTFRTDRSSSTDGPFIVHGRTVHPPWTDRSSSADGPLIFRGRTVHPPWTDRSSPVDGPSIFRTERPSSGLSDNLQEEAVRLLEKPSTFCATVPPAWEVSQYCMRRSTDRWAVNQS
ncbi:hypothetical protein BV898_18870 [Hypsibius exemplaris]|uniref:Uncharacterized protein n=1 Tax=Hypsibius exemplaris TaxID=2072580 RepID=A0A9X6RNK3_HYPEX|nr:hypothetical protein BV898_18870 [Hypsibius exemplaris]